MGGGGGESGELQLSSFATLPNWMLLNADKLQALI